ncbi:MAG: 5'/3'-nucleotidase SurE [Candidatus Latescibacterota bacterium]|nr:5'/3'-nucleotidase SurE [Candidatus Latescibacterota bacterium]
MIDAKPPLPTGPWILVSNDDGIDSPALPSLLEALRGFDVVRCVVPAREYSWSAKTMSRFDSLEMVETNRDPCPIYRLDGSPADCVNAGIHNLYPHHPPELVISGVNIGANAGLAFLLSSGTVGAALEGMLSGVPSMAVSQEMSGEDYARWRDHRDVDHLQASWQEAGVVAAEVADEILRGGLPAGADLLSINLPPGATRHSTRVLATVANTRYGPFFERVADGRLQHVYSPLQRLDGDDGVTDLDALARGHIALTPLRFGLNSPHLKADRARFERSR